MKYINAILIVLLVLLQYRLWYGTGGLPELWALEEVKKSKIQDTQRATRHAIKPW